MLCVCLAGGGVISFSFQDIRTKSAIHFSVKSAFVVDSTCGLFTKFFLYFFYFKLQAEVAANDKSTNSGKTKPEVCYRVSVKA